MNNIIKILIITVAVITSSMAKISALNEILALEQQVVITSSVTLLRIKEIT